jgi:RimJ/RimL family protein N-acetyltransferase
MRNNLESEHLILSSLNNQSGKPQYKVLGQEYKPMKIDFVFSQARPSDRSMIEDWITRPHISEWLHGEGLKNTLSSLTQFFEGSSDFQHWIAYDNGTPFGYLLTSEVDQSDETLSSIEFAGSKAITLDVFICELEYLGRGIGTEMIKAFLKTHFSNVSDVLIDPEVTNTRAVHVYKKIGFQIIETFIAPWHPVPHYLMHLRYDSLKK